MQDLRPNESHTFDRALLEIRVRLAKKGQRQNIMAFQHMLGDLNKMMQK